MSQFTDLEVEVLTEVIEARAHIGDLVIRILHKRHKLPQWMLTAHENKWEPHRDWRKEEREQIADTIRNLIDRHYLGIGGPWDIYACITEMELLARQSVAD